MGEMKNRRVILEAMEIMDTLSDVQNFDGKEKIIEVLDAMSGDYDRFARDLAAAMYEKGQDPTQFKAFVDSLQNYFTNSTEIGEPGGAGDEETDIFFDPNKPKNPIKSNLNVKTLSQTRQRDEELDRYPQGPGQGKRIKYEEL